MQGKMPNMNTRQSRGRKVGDQFVIEYADGRVITLPASKKVSITETTELTIESTPAGPKAREVDYRVLEGEMKIRELRAKVLRRQAETITVSKVIKAIKSIFE